MTVRTAPSSILDYVLHRPFFHYHGGHPSRDLAASGHLRRRRATKAWSMEVETVLIVSGSMSTAPNRSPCNAFRSLQRANRFRSAPIERCKPTKKRDSPAEAHFSLRGDRSDGE